MSEDPGRPAPAAPRRWMRRALLSMLAGGGMTAAGLGGPLTGAVGAGEPHITPPPNTGATGEGTTGAASTSTSSSTAATEPPPSTSSSSTSSSASSSLSSSETSSSHSAGGPPSGGRRRPSASGGEGGHVYVQPRQAPASPKPRRKGRPASPHTGAPSTPAPGSHPSNVPSNVAAPPQMVAAHANLLSALSRGLSVSTQALDLFYQVPPFLLPIYQAAAVQYGVPWEILAAINEVETDYGNDLSVSTAGAVGWMQFMPATWLQYGVDALDAGYADPYNPVDAIFAAARYLAAAGAAQNLRGAIFSYNHSEEYVESVLLRARLLASYPPSAIATLTGLIEGVPPLQGARVVPSSVDAAAFTTAPGSNGSSTAAGQSSATANAVPAPSPQSAAAGAGARASTVGGIGGAGRGGHAGRDLMPRPDQLVEMEGGARAPVVAVQSGRIAALGTNRALGRYIVLEDVYGDLFTYAGMGSVASRYRTSEAGHGQAPSSAAIGARTAAATPPTAAASAGSQPPLTLSVSTPAAHAKAAAAPAATPQAPPAESTATAAEGSGKMLLYAHPANPDAQVVSARLRAAHPGKGWAPLRVGAVVSQGTVLGTPAPAPARASSLGGPTTGTTGATGAAAGAAASGGMLRFAIRPAGDATAVDPVPVVQNWYQLQRALHPQGAKGGSGLVGSTANDVFLLSQEELERAVLADPSIELPACARQQVAGGRVDGRVLSLLLFLSRNGLAPTVSQIRCGGRLRGSAALYSAIDRGEGVDITKIGGVPIAEHQGTGTITDLAIRTILTLQGRFAPHRIVSLMRYPGAPSTQASADHAGLIEVDFQPESGPAAPVRAGTAAHSAGPGATAPSPLAVSLGLRTVSLTTGQWNRLVERIAALPQPNVPTKPTSAAIKDPQGSAPQRGTTSATRHG
jgi:hypothetical protein